MSYIARPSMARAARRAQLPCFGYPITGTYSLARFYSNSNRTPDNKHSEAQKEPVSNSENAFPVGSSNAAKAKTASEPSLRGGPPQKRPRTLDDHLKQVQSQWGRLAVRTKWALIKSYRPFNTDEIGAVFSWIIWGHILWILLGTTTFISLVVWAMSQFRTQDALARWVGWIVTKETGLRVVFEHAIVPDWKSGAIVFRKVFIQRRPGAVNKVATGSQAEALSDKAASPSTNQDNGNYTQFDLTVDTIAVTLSLKRWLSGRGILETVEARGVRGVVDRRFVKFDPTYDPTKHRKVYKRGDFDWETTKVEDLVVTVLQPDHQEAALKYAAEVRALRDQGYSQPEILREMREQLAKEEEAQRSMQKEAQLISASPSSAVAASVNNNQDNNNLNDSMKNNDNNHVSTGADDKMNSVSSNGAHEAGGLPPFQFCLFNCELPRLRKQWLFYDMLNANYVSGSFDNAMFSMHTRQLPTDVNVNVISSRHHTRVPRQTFKKVQRLRIDNVDIRHLNRGVTGMFGWIESGSCDFLADIMLPNDDIELTFKEQMKDLLERWEAQVKQIWTNGQPGDIVTQVEQDVLKRESQKTVTIDLRVQFNNPRATAPLYSPDLNYLNNAIIHPMVAYINSRDTYIPVHCHVAKRMYDFDGSWTVYDSGLMADLSSEIYRAFARNAQDDEERSRRIKKVGFWSLQFMAQLVLLTLGIVA